MAITDQDYANINVKYDTFSCSLNFFKKYEFAKLETLDIEFSRVCENYKMLIKKRVFQSCILFATSHFKRALSALAKFHLKTSWFEMWTRVSEVLTLFQLGGWDENVKLKFCVKDGRRPLKRNWFVLK